MKYTDKGYTMDQCLMLQKRRMEMGLSRQQINEQMGMSKSFYGNIEDGRIRTPRIYTILEILHLDAAEFANVGRGVLPDRKPDKVAAIVTEPVTEPVVRFNTKDEELPVETETLPEPAREPNVGRLNSMLRWMFDNDKGRLKVINAWSFADYLLSKMTVEQKLRIVDEYIHGDVK